MPLFSCATNSSPLTSIRILPCRFWPHSFLFLKMSESHPSHSQPLTLYHREKLLLGVYLLWTKRYLARWFVLENFALTALSPIPGAFSCQSFESRPGKFLVSFFIIPGFGAAITCLAISGVFANLAFCSRICCSECM